MESSLTPTRYHRVNMSISLYARLYLGKRKDFVMCSFVLFSSYALTNCVPQTTLFLLLASIKMLYFCLVSFCLCGIVNSFCRLMIPQTHQKFKEIICSSGYSLESPSAVQNKSSAIVYWRARAATFVQDRR